MCHDLVGNLAVFMHKLAPKHTLRPDLKRFYLRKSSPLGIELMCKVSHFYRKVHIKMACGSTI